MRLGWLRSRGWNGVWCCCAALLVSVWGGCGDDASTDAGAVGQPREDANAGHGSLDGSTGDAGTDTGALDAGPDAGRGPNGAMDASLDAGHDAGAPADASDDGGDAALRDAETASPTGLPATLAETGLYKAGSTQELAPGVMEYSPAYPLWSDGAEKHRYLWLPENTQIDTSDMDAWVFPAGTKVWKEFRRDGKRIETRILQKTEQGWLRVAYVWNDDESQATQRPEGVQNARGTEHDVPQRGDCSECHDGRPDKLLGVSAVQLSGQRSGVTLNTLIARGRLTDPPPNDFALPDTDAWNALGYLHANCGTCHNPTSIQWDRVNLDLWLRTSQLSSPEETESYKSTVNHALDSTGGALSLRIAAGEPGQSEVIARMQRRGDEKSMPPLGSEQVDDAGVATVSRFIEGL